MTVINTGVLGKSDLEAPNAPCLQCGKYTTYEEDAHQPIHRACVDKFLHRPIISQDAAWALYEFAEAWEEHSDSCRKGPPIYDLHRLNESVTARVRAEIGEMEGVY